jgi:hypothetical protein
MKPSRHDRTVAQFVKEIDHVAGLRIKLGWRPASGLFLEDTETGAFSVLGWGMHRWSVLSPADQENICRELNREHLIVQLMLDWYE